MGKGIKKMRYQTIALQHSSFLKVAINKAFQQGFVVHKIETSSKVYYEKEFRTEMTFNLLVENYEGRMQTIEMTITLDDVLKGVK